MFGSQFDFRHGDVDESRLGDVTSAADAVPAYDTIKGDASDTLGSLAHRAYGVNTQDYRDRIARANPGRTVGTIRVPR